MTENGSEEALLVRAKPLGLAQSVCEGLVDEVRIVEGSAPRDAAPARRHISLPGLPLGSVPGRHPPEPFETR